MATRYLLVAHQVAHPVPPPTYQEVIRADNPDSWWQLGDASGTVAVDEMAAHNGTYTNGPTLGVAGPVAGVTAVDFTGSSPARFVNVAGYTAMPALASIEAWIESGNLSDDGIAGWFSSAGLKFFLYGQSSDQVVLSVNGTDIMWDSAGAVNTGWHHIVGTYDGTDGRLYVDGVLRVGPTAVSYSGGTSTYPFQVGNYGNTYAANFNGSIAQVALYSHVLTAEHIAAHYEAAQ